MNHTTLLRLEILGLCLCMLALPALATTLTVGSATLPAAGATTSIVITGDSFPDGLRGYSMNATFTDPSIAEVTEITFPPGMLFTENSTVPSTDFKMKAATFSVTAGSTDVTLATLTLKGKTAGTTSLNLDISQITAIGGGTITPVIVPGTINVGGMPTTGSIAVTSSPAGAAITLDSTGTGQVTPYTFTSQTPGPHSVGVSLAGYQSASQTVTVSAGTTVPADFTLVPVSPTTGSLSITSSPSGATATVDGTGYGPTPAVVSGLSPGSHTLGLSLTGYQPYSGTASVTAGVITPVIIVLTPVPVGEPGYLTIYSFPTKATVIIDGTAIGITPQIDIALSPGSHTLKVSAAGYSEYISNVDVISGQHKRLPFVILQRTSGGGGFPTPTITTTVTQTGSPGETGGMSVKSFPKNAVIYLNNEVKGNTPATIQGLAPGDYELKLVYPRYQTKVKTVTVEAGKITAVPLILMFPDRFTR